MTRNPKSPRQRAEEALAVARRRLEKAHERVAKTGAAHREAGLELQHAAARHDYLAQDPALGDETAAGDDVRVS